MYDLAAPDAGGIEKQSKEKLIANRGVEVSAKLLFTLFLFSFLSFTLSSSVEFFHVFLCLFVS